MLAGVAGRTAVSAPNQLDIVLPAFHNGGITRGKPTEIDAVLGDRKPSAAIFVNFVISTGLCIFVHVVEVQNFSSDGSKRENALSV